jgi:hypothetical protein
MPRVFGCYELFRTLMIVVLSSQYVAWRSFVEVG